ncbi:hypothetical protein A3860_18635 [Niastella vici]|uniref:Uncharacterized protein n=1 Tax=Niastella vici TaxID=1703345 RepID=A0A1V9G2U0_9BACT|nr:hypothetical protein [Niastella vici]OQP64776.1 hypothetical protein A3860_18635 [Niastella vici]
MKIVKKPIYIFLRWIAVLPVVALTIILMYLIFQKMINEESSKGNAITTLIYSFIWAAVTVYSSIGISMSTAPTHKKLTGSIIGILVALSLIILFIYLVNIYGFTGMIIVKIIGFITGLIVAYFVLKDDDAADSQHANR